MARRIQIKASKRAKAHVRLVDKKAPKAVKEVSNSFSPNSSMISKVSFNPKNSTMYVNFHNGHTYSYKGVDSKTFHAMRISESAGKFFHKHIKSQYKTNKHF